MKEDMVSAIILHHSASTFGNAALIDSWHRAKGWDCIGYHFVILNGCLKKGVYRGESDGLIETGRDIDHMGAHTYGHNRDTIGICLIGDRSLPFGGLGYPGNYTRLQMNALGRLLRDLGVYGGRAWPEIKQHSDYFPESKPFCAMLDTKAIQGYVNIR